jgi:hypothetical protein
MLSEIAEHHGGWHDPASHDGRHDPASHDDR